MKSLLTIVADGATLAHFLLLLAAAALVLFVLPGALRIFSLELERLKRGRRHAFHPSFAQGRGKMLGGAPVH